MPLSTDLREFIECLNSNKVDYLVVGALAVSWHGFPRYSADIDFLIRPSHANAERVLRALSQFGFGSLDISASDLTLTGKVIQLGYEPNRTSRGIFPSLPQIAKPLKTLGIRHNKYGLRPVLRTAPYRTLCQALLSSQILL